MVDNEQTTTNYQLYGAIFVLILYFGGISPWEAEIIELRERVDKQKRNAANPSRFINKARLAVKKLEKKKKQFVHFLSNLPPVEKNTGNTDGKVGSQSVGNDGGNDGDSDEDGEMTELSTLERFAVVVSACGKHKLPLPDIAPVAGIQNNYFKASGCSFDLLSKNERTIYKFLRTVQLHKSQARIRFLQMSYGRSRGEGVKASITLSWPTYKKAGASAARGIETTAIVLPDEKAISKWAIFTDRPKKRRPVKSGKGRRGTSPSSLEAKSTSAGGDSKIANGSSSSGSSESGSGSKDSGKGASSDGSKSAEVASSLKGMTLLGTISIAGIDGIIVPAGGKQKIVLAGDNYRGWTLLSVTSDSARLQNGGRISEVKLVRKSLLADDGSKNTDSNAAETKDSGATILAKIPSPKELGIHGIMTSSRKIDGGKIIRRKGFRQGILIKEVDVDSLAYGARMVADDYIYKINGKALRTPTQLRVAASQVSKNNDVTFTLLRRGVTTEVTCSN